MKVPRAPGYEYVFLWGALWYGLIERWPGHSIAGSLCMTAAVWHALRRMDR